MAQIIAIVQFGRNMARPPFGIGLGEAHELRVRHQIPVKIEIVDCNRVLGDLILEQLRHWILNTFSSEGICVASIPT